MASQPSAHNEERNRLRLRAWEQRNQETSQAKELKPEKVPLFGEPFKTNKGDELSNRIQRMLGSYEDVNNPSPFTTEPSPIPTSDQPDAEKPTKPAFHNHYASTQSEKPPCSNGYPSQPARTSTASSSPNHYGHSTAVSNTPLNQSQLGHSAYQQVKTEASSDLRERVRLPQEISSKSPDAKPPAFQRSGEQDTTDTDAKDVADRHQPQKSTDHTSEGGGAVDVPTLNPKQSPKDTSLPQANKGNALPSQTFPSLLPSKQPSVVMTRKPTAYVRPMDGQDQVVSESPELKPSPQPYVPLPELINKSDLDKGKVLPQFLETRTNEAQCVEDILREMTHSWPPLLTAIRTPSTGEPSKTLFKEPERVSSCSGQKNDSSPADPSPLIQQSSSSSFEAAHSRGAESASSSDSDSSSRSESDSESTNEEPPARPATRSVETQPDTPAVTHVDWLLGNWIRPSQPSSSSTESQSSAHASKSLAHKQPPPTQSSQSSQSSQRSSVEVIDPGRKPKPQLSPHKKEFTKDLGKPQQCRENPQDNCNKTYSANVKRWRRKLSCYTFSKPAEAVDPGPSGPAPSEKCEGAVARGDKDPRFTDRPKVKTKIGHGKRSKASGDPKRDSKRTSKHTSLDKRKAGSEPEPKVTLVLHSHCPSCGVRYPNPCSCPPQSPAQPQQPSPDPPGKISKNKPKSETVCQTGSKTPHKTTHKHPEKTGHAAKSSGPPHRPPRSLLVKIDLRLLSRVPQTSSNHQKTPGKRSVLVLQQDGGGGGGGDASTQTHKLHETSKKSIPQNLEVDNKTVPRKKPRLENKNTSSSQASIKLETSSTSTDDRERKKAKKNPPPSQLPATPKDSTKDSKLLKRSCGETHGTSKEAVKSKESRKHKKGSGKHGEKEPQKSSSSSQPTREVSTNRPLLRFDDRHYPVKHYIKEAKKLKHKADAESDKFSKAFNYLDAAMYFVESGIAMEKDPQISMSSYTMFAETVELLKFVLKLKNSVDAPAPPSEKDFLCLCLKCQSLLQMAMFRHKHKTALKYSKTLSDHFSSVSQKTHDSSVLTSKLTDTPSPMPSMPSPAITSSSSGPASNHSGSGSVADPAGGAVAVPQAIEQVAFTYVNITTLFLSAHDIWEQAEELVHKGSGLLAELDAAMGPLSLTSSMSFMVRYTRQGLHWLRLSSQKVM